MLCKLSGISFAELPYLTSGDPVTVVREVGKPWDSDRMQAYSVRLEGLHIGYIPLLETINEQIVQATKGFVKKWANKYQDMSKSEIRKVAEELNKAGKSETFHAWEYNPDRAHASIQHLSRHHSATEAVRDWIYVEMERNHFTPTGMTKVLWWDDKNGYNSNEIGEIRGISADFDVEGAHCVNSFGTQTSSALAAYEASRSDSSG